jgi:hypothetical protein
MSDKTFLVLNLAIAFYNVGTIWAHEVDIFRGWKFLDPKTFSTVQQAHWKKLTYWIFIPVGVSFLGSIGLFKYHPISVPFWLIVTAFLVQLSSHVLTGIFWGQWQAKLSKDNLGGESPYLRKILKTHWVRTVLITTYAFLLFYATLLIL